MPNWKKLVPWVAGALLGAFLSSFVLYHVPVTQDRFGHTYFSKFSSDRLVAYWMLFKSRVVYGQRGMGREQVETFVDEYASEIGLDPDLAKAVVWFESRFRRAHVSTTGAMGLMALMPATARSNGVVDPYDPRDNLRGGMRLLKRLVDRYPGDVDRAVAAYNAGYGAVDRYDGVPPFKETQDYVRSVRILYRGLKDGEVGAFENATSLTSAE